MYLAMSINVLLLQVKNDGFTNMPKEGVQGKNSYSHRFYRSKCLASITSITHTKSISL